VNYLIRIARSLARHPRFFVMRTVARFDWVRHAAVKLQQFWRRADFRRFQAAEKGRRSRFFPDADVHGIGERLLRDGVAFGLKLQPEVVAQLRAFADGQPLWAERNPAYGFPPGQADKARERLGRRFLLAQYFNIEKRSQLIAELARDPVLLEIAASYLGTRPILVGANMWWSFPETASEGAHNEAAQMFHYDLDDFRFLKFFFYLTDVDEESGPHVVVRGSHEDKRFGSFSETLKVRRYSDAEIEAWHGKDRIVVITGEAGTCFAEDTLCIHKGTPPRAAPRLLLQLQYAFNDFGNQNDIVADDRLAMIV
jgi:hypothetical protein